jgi:GMP synthase (glutamine-hydrolysing)
MTGTRSTRRVLVVQHVPWEAPGRILPALETAGVGVEIRTLVAESDPQLPSLDDVAGLVIMGGPMGADNVERYPALALERDLARRAVDSEVPVLGVCLGHQILALAMGGDLHPDATRELGMAPISLIVDSPLGAANTELVVLHWHFDNVTAPPGAEVLARTVACPNQAFRVGSAFGMQFHLEVDPPLLATWLTPDAMGDQASATAMQSALARADPGLAEVGGAVFGQFAIAVQRR